MKSRPHAKINLGLYVTGRWYPGESSISSSGASHSASGRETTSSYHEIESILLPVDLSDTLEVTPSASSDTRLFTSGIPIPGKASSNLCITAYELLRRAYRNIPAVDIYLHKRIPPGSGLGGGSSNAAHMLMLLNRLFQLEIDDKKMSHLAASIGSDSPFFLQKGIMLAKGRGEVLSHINIKGIEWMKMVIVVPPLHISTKWAYSKIIPEHPVRSLQTLSQLPVTKWQGAINNRFEEVVFAQHPQLRAIKNSLLDKGAVYSSLSGTGSGVYGLFSSSPPVQDIRDTHPDCQVFNTSPGVC